MSEREGENECKREIEGGREVGSENETVRERDGEYEGR